MVRAHKTMEAVTEKKPERRVSSPIGIPTSKVATLNRTYNNIIESSESLASNSPVASPGNYGPLPNLSSSVPNRGNPVQATGVVHDDHHDSEESISELLDRLPECSPAFNTVFSELVKLESERREKVEEESTSNPTRPSHVEQKASPASTPSLLRKGVRVIRFELPEMRPRASSHSVNLGKPLRKPRTKESPSSTQSTPAMSRRTRPKNGVTITKAVNVVPKFKFLTETITVSHEDIVKEQESQDKMRNGYPSPKSIFGVMEEK